MQRAGQTSLCFSSIWSVWKMSFEEIISEIQGKPEIWLSRHPLYKSRATAKKTWNEIPVKLGMEGIIYIFILLCSYVFSQKTCPLFIATEDVN
jgi:hypothetical protein